ncbi:unnamed protein product, partial [Allacma fusca]
MTVFHITITTIFSFWIYQSNCNPSIVSVTQGKLQGAVSASRGDRKFLSFLGIPYAAVGRRFQVAEPPGDWIGIRNAQNFRNVCAQIEPITSEVLGSEDCLYLNVFVPH